VPGPSDSPRQKSAIRALFDWLKPAARQTASAGPGPGMPARLGHYRIERQLGAGGMGVVYAAHDEKLHRAVAVKTIAGVGRDEERRQRFWREARLAASVNHPNICQIYEIGDAAGTLFIAMELLEGTPLSDQLKQGAMSVDETLRIGRGMLSALSALHARGIVHRDLKPSNVFLTPHGVKLLDFGVARSTAALDSEAPTALTHANAVIGTPRYMAPEQAIGDPVDGRSDLFSTGAILFEMLAGRPAFDGKTVVAVLQATLNEEPPALSGSPSVAAIDRVIRRALAKKPVDRPASAEAMTDELRDVQSVGAGPASPPARAMTRLVVLPFRSLRADPDTDFLAFSLPDAITSSLSGLPSLVVRSSAMAARFAGETPDLKAIASEAGVDRVVLGSILRAGDELRVSAQLVEAPEGTVLASHTVQMPMGDLFALQDDVARRVREELALPASPAAPTPITSDRPQNPRAYELYLRANEIARTYEGLPRARDLYERALAIDPGFAPAWARLGRCHRVIGKFIDSTPDSGRRAESAFLRALELNPRLTIAHKYYAGFEADIGQAERAMVRLLGEATRHGNDPELFAGLVHACRYCGLFDESLAAHAEARRLDPHIETSYMETLLLKGDVDRLLGATDASLHAGADDGMRVIGLGLAGRRDEARRTLAEMQERPRIPAFRTWMAHLAAWLEDRREDMFATLDEIGGLAIFQDPEAVFQEGWLLCDVGEHARAMPYLDRALARRYYVAPTLVSWPQFDALRGDPGFQALLSDAEAGRARARVAFVEAGGERLLGR
jgi:serine/threonine protein kinase/tetratricopeptide (TPR) repeat protein